MADDKLEDTAASPDSRLKRAAPTIDLEATDVSHDSPKTDSPWTSPDVPHESAPVEEAVATEAAPAPEPEPAPTSAAHAVEMSRPVSPWVVAPISGVVAAALVIGVGWLLGWPAVQPPSAPQTDAAAIGNLTSRVAGLEAKLGKPAPADPAMAARIDALDRSIATLRSDLTAARAQSDKLAAAPRDGGPAVDLSAVTARIAAIEGAVKTQGATIAKQDGQIAAAKAEAKPADDTPLRRVVAASLLDVAVRHGDLYVSALAAAKASAADPAALKPLEIFAATGVPNPSALCRDLLEIVPQLAPPAAAPTVGTGLVDRLQASASKLIRIERTDANGTDRGSIVARVTSAAVHNDLAAAERELKSLPPADRTAAQAWLDKVDARNAALAASRKYADTAMAALASVNQ